MRTPICGALIVLLGLSTTVIRSSAQAAAAKAQAGSDAPNGDARKGATEFSDCVNCHGRNAEGGFGPGLAGTGLAWSSFRKSVREPWGLMPAFKDPQKPEQALADIYTYLRSLPPATELGEWHWPKAPPTAPLGQRLYMNFAGCGQCHEPEGKFPRARLGVMARDVTFDYFKRQIYQHYERWPKGRMPLYTPERLPEVVLREMYTWLVDELGLRPWVGGSLSVERREAGKTSYALDVVNSGVKDKGLVAEGLTVFVRIPPGCSVIAGSGPGWGGTMPLATLGLEPALRLAPHPHDDSGVVERPKPDLSRDVAVWRLPRIEAGERVSLSFTLSGPEPTPELAKGFEGSTIHWTTPGRRPAGSPPHMVYRDLRIPDQGDHELVTGPQVAAAR
jgi:mono/diheme cytochrome c family protein